MADDEWWIEAEPFPFVCGRKDTALLIIDMQNDFCSPGGFAERLGNDISPARAIIPQIAELLRRFRELGLPVIHTREGHLPDLSDCPPGKLFRSRRCGAGIGDPGPMGRLLIRGERGHDIVPELAPLPGEPVIDKPGKGAFLPYRSGRKTPFRRNSPVDRHGRHNARLRPYDHS